MLELGNVHHLTQLKQDYASGFFYNFGLTPGSFIYSRTGTALTCTTGHSQSVIASHAVINHENKSRI